MRSGTRSIFKVGWTVVEQPIVGFTSLSTITALHWIRTSNVNFQISRTTSAMVTGSTSTFNVQLRLLKASNSTDRANTNVGWYKYVNLPPPVPIGISMEEAAFRTMMARR